MPTSGNVIEIPRGRARARPARGLLAPFAFILAICASAPVRASDFGDAISGIWRTDISKLMADATVYFVLASNNSCQQVIKIELLGFTKWSARTCTWRLDDELLTLSLQKSATPEEEKETMAQIKVAEVTADSLIISSNGETQRWTRAIELPPEFQAHLQIVPSQ